MLSKLVAFFTVHGYLSEFHIITHTKYLFIPFTESPACGPVDFRCRNGQCISTVQHCDLVDNCADGTDEIDCCMYHNN